MTDGNVVREVRNRIVNAAVVFSHLKKSEPPPPKKKKPKQNKPKQTNKQTKKKKKQQTNKKTVVAKTKLNLFRPNILMVLT